MKTMFADVTRIDADRRKHEIICKVHAISSIDFFGPRNVIWITLFGLICALSNRITAFTGVCDITLKLTP